MSELITKLGALLAAVFASIGDFAPLLARATGSRDLAALASLAVYRPYFIGLAGLALLYSFSAILWEKYRRGTLARASYRPGREEVILAVTTGLVLLAIFFPYVRGAIPAMEEPVYEGKGVVIRVDQTELKVTLDHGPIGDVLPAMSMQYPVESPLHLKDLKSGDVVSFTLTSRGVDFVVVEIKKLKKERTRGR